ncbi:uncharacterized protein EI90DRAFT_2646801 [Cantharellus anzutake]|uniref:uncharacterized protein n=1 Tax=Cantharellus anzutake TaxID=1750568 RepID=UPI0019071803|nr:uncharacterized protein EI90DRAFT_2646801 [Cantharellus anzutake]KAF8337402.1 hypothetical protein EI90DRAFT_2646801 [Cantharellus anzutake]
MNGPPAHLPVGVSVQGGVSQSASSSSPTPGSGNNGGNGAIGAGGGNGGGGGGGQASPPIQRPSSAAISQPPVPNAQGVQGVQGVPVPVPVPVQTLPTGLNPAQAQAAALPFTHRVPPGTSSHPTGSGVHSAGLGTSGVPGVGAGGMPGLAQLTPEQYRSLALHHGQLTPEAVKNAVNLQQAIWVSV